MCGEVVVRAFGVLPYAGRRDGVPRVREGGQHGAGVRSEVDDVLSWEVGEGVAHVEVEECVVVVVVVDLVEGLVDDVGSVGGANATLCGVEVGLDLGSGLEEDGFGS